MKSKITGAVLFITLFMPAAAMAQQRNYDEAGHAINPSANYDESRTFHKHGAHKHDGFYLRMQVGPGYTRSTILLDDKSTDTYVHGFGVALTLEVGGSVVENLQLFAKLAGRNGVNPKFSIANESLDGKNFTHSFFGPGMSYYIMPINVFLSASGGIAMIGVQNTDANVDYESKYGFGAVFGIGKEFWVTDNWGLGIAAEFDWSRTTDKDIDELQFRTWGVNLGFSATFN